MANLANDLIKGSNENAEVLAEVINLMKTTDFNLFILFSNRNDPGYKGENDSTIVELSTLVQSETYSDKKDKILVCLPKSKTASMLDGLFGLKRLNIYEYENFCEVLQRCFIFIKQKVFK